MELAAQLGPGVGHAEGGDLAELVQLPGAQPLPHSPPGEAAGEEHV